MYEGLGWDKAVRLNTTKNNCQSVRIAFIGSSNDVSPSLEQMKAAVQLIELGVKERKLSVNYNIL